MTSAEDGAGWLAFFRDLVARGLSGVALVTSDAHPGLVAAIGAKVAEHLDAARAELLALPPSLSRYACPQTGEVVDGDHNAARNLRDWPDHASCGPVRATAPSVPGSTNQVGTGHGADAGSSGAVGAPVRPDSSGAGSGAARSKTLQGGRRMSVSEKTHTQRQRHNGGCPSAAASRAHRPASAPPRQLAGSLPPGVLL